MLAAAAAQSQLSRVTIMAVCAPAIPRNPISSERQDELPGIMQVHEDQIPRYRSFKEPLAPVDAALVHRIVTEFCAAYSDGMAEHGISQGDYKKGFRDK